MKRIIFTALVMISFHLIASAQVKVFSSGKTVMGNNTGITDPAGQIHIVRALNEQKQAIFADAPTSEVLFTNTFSSLYLGNSNGTNNNYARMNFGDGDAGAVASVAAQIQNHANNGGSLEFWTRPNGGGSILKRMSVENDGNIVMGSGAVQMGNLLTVHGAAAKTGSSTWNIISDQNLKKDVRTFEDGLDEILKIKPVTFKYNGKAGIQDTETEYVGILAQEIKEIAPYMVSEFTMDVYQLKEVTNEHDRGLEVDRSTKQTESYLQFDANALTYMLINAVKEQQKMIEEKEDRIVELENRFNQLEGRIEELVSRSTGSVVPNQTEVSIKGSDLAVLEQNIPNPFNGVTMIDYVIPASAKNAQIDIYNINGRLIKSVALDHVGEGRLTVQVDEMPAGTYSYQLVVDGAPVANNKMVLVR